MRGRRPAFGGLLVVALLVLAPPVAAHPLGNATVSRAVAVTISASQLQIAYVVDMAEIPAYAAKLEIDRDRDGWASADERHAWADATCGAAGAGLDIAVDDQATVVRGAGSPSLSFPPGVGGLETLRLVCPLVAAMPASSGTHRLVVNDRLEDGRRGWREVTIVADRGITLVASDVPSVSPSRLLTAYPEDLLTAPVEATAGSATFRVGTSSPGPGAGSGLTGIGSGSEGNQSLPLVDLLAEPRTPIAWLLAFMLAMGLGAAHAMSPGHGKALIAAYVIGSRSATGQAVVLALSAAASHTIGVLVLGGLVLTASELLVPERVVAWLSMGSGILVVIFGGVLAARAIRRRSALTGNPNVHVHPPGRADDHDHGPEAHRHEAHWHEAPRAPLHEILALGLVGGAIPSTSALLVLLVAIATGRLVEGMLLIVAFGAGMAIVLGGLAAVTAMAGRRLAGATQLVGAPLTRRLAGAAPLVSGAVVMAVGAVTAIGALGGL